MKDKWGNNGALSKIAKNVGWLLAGKGFGAVLSIIYLGLATRILGPSGFGQFALIVGLAQTVAGLVTFQTWRLVVLYGHGAGARSYRSNAESSELGSQNDIDAVVNFALKLDCLAALAGCAIAIVGVSIFAGPMNWSSENATIALAYAIIALLAIRSTAVGTLRLYDQFRHGAAADAIMPVTRMAGALGAVVFMPTVNGFLAAWAASELTTAAAYWWMVKRHTPVRIDPWHSRSMRRVVRDHPGIIRFTWLTNIGSALSSLSQNLPVLIIGWFAGPASAGLYRLAHQLSQAMMRIADMLSRSIYPELAKVHAYQGGDASRALTRTTTSIALIGSVFMVALIIFAGRSAIEIVAGSEFLPAYPLLVLLGIAASMELAGVAFEPMLTASGQTGKVLLIRLCSTLVLLGGIFLLLPRWDVIGAAWATLAGSIASVLLFSAAVAIWGRAPP